MFHMVVCSHKVGEVESECTFHNFIFTPNIIKFSENLAKLWQKQFWLFFSEARYIFRTTKKRTSISLPTKIHRRPVYKRLYSSRYYLQFVSMSFFLSLLGLVFCKSIQLWQRAVTVRRPKGDAENARNENAAPYCVAWKYETWKSGTILRGMKIRDMKMRHQK